MERPGGDVVGEFGDPVAGRALGAVVRPGTPAEVAVSRVMTRSGAWVVLHGVPLAAPGPQRVAVIVEPAHPARISPLLMSAYGLTEREQELTRLVLQGHSTAEIAELLTISVHTVQQHLKSIFDKTGVRSRRDLVTNVFFAYYEPGPVTTRTGPHRGFPCAAGPSVASRSRRKQRRPAPPARPGPGVGLHAALVVPDEPTTGLDPEQRASLRAVLSGLGEMSPAMRMGPG